METIVLNVAKDKSTKTDNAAAHKATTGMKRPQFVKKSTIKTDVPQSKIQTGMDKTVSVFQVLK